jgi:hypothetical protein
MRTRTGWGSADAGALPPAPLARRTRIHRVGAPPPVGALFRRMPASTPRPTGRSRGDSRDGRHGRGSREPRGGLLRAGRREQHPGMLRPDCTSCPTLAEVGGRTGWGCRAGGGEAVGGGDSKVLQRGRRIWLPRAPRRPEPQCRIHPCAPAGERECSASRRRGGDPAAWAAGFAAEGER